MSVCVCVCVCARARACVCLYIGGRCDNFNVGAGVTVCRCVGVVLTVNVKAVEGRNTSNICALNRSQKGCFMF